VVRILTQRDTAKLNSKAAKTRRESPVDFRSAKQVNAVNRADRFGNVAASQNSPNLTERGIGPCGNKHLLLIGAGQGSWCKILNDILGFKSCTLVDLPEQLELAKKCLGEWKIKNVKFVTPEELSTGVVYDIVISDMSFSEFNRPYQELLLDRAIACSNSGFIVGHEFPKHFGVVSLNFDQLKERFDRLGNFIYREMQKPSEDRESYFLYWKKQT
jgi:hypothetical protein